VQLALLVRSVIPQLEPGDELIVVDDQSTVATQRRLAQIATTAGAQFVRLPPAPSSGRRGGRRSEARNAAIRLATGEVMLFLDGDMLLSPGYLREIRRHHAYDRATMVRGQRIAISRAEQEKGDEHCLSLTVTSPFHRHDDPISYALPRAGMGGTSFLLALAAGAMGTMRITRRHFAAMIAQGVGPVAMSLAPPGTDLAPFYSQRWDYCASNNLSVRREHVVHGGGWDETFVGWGEEDMDFAYRLYLRGIRPVLPVGTEIRAFHLDHPVDEEMNRASLLRNARYLLSKFPELRRIRLPAYAAWGITDQELR
jgi:glycosyltransferase involved in cell wall biosynthesis